MRSTLAFLVAALLAHSCTDSGTGPEERRFNLLFRYGIAARNELNTYNDTFTKDLILDGTKTIRLVLSQRDFDIIESILLDADIFAYPDTFIVQHGDTVGRVDPHPTYVLKLSLDGKQKDLVWRDGLIIFAPDPRATKLREAFQSIQALIQAKPEYQQLPPARGGYL